MDEQEFNNRNSIKVVDEKGTIRYYNNENQLHRKDGPAVEYTDGAKSWWVNDKCHREDGPALECANGDKFWYINGKRHREDGPAIEWANGYKAWYINGQRHRLDGPAIEWADGSKSWFINGDQLTEQEFNDRNSRKVVDEKGTIKYYNNENQLHREDGPAVESFTGKRRWFINGQYHREDGPAIEWANGDKYWYINDKLHREDGPAIEWSDGSKFWYINGKLHREDGPACEWADGKKEWYINDNKLTEQEFNNRNLRKVVNKYGTIRHYNKEGQYHREDGPACEYADGTKYWYINGRCHREDGPAIEWFDGSKFWYINGKLHREDGPAIEYANGTKFWYINGNKLTEQEFNDCNLRKVVDEKGTIKYYNNENQLHREDGPAVEWFNGSKSWYINGKLHREDGPAVEHADDYKSWFINGKCHREDGPAVEYANGDKFWYVNGKCHREDGPAVETANGSKSWYINGNKLTEQEFNDHRLKLANHCSNCYTSDTYILTSDGMKKIDELNIDIEKQLKSLILIPYNAEGDLLDVVQSMTEGINDIQDKYNLSNNSHYYDKLQQVITNWALTAMCLTEREEQISSLEEQVDVANDRILEVAKNLNVENQKLIKKNKELQLEHRRLKYALSMKVNDYLEKGD